MKWFDQLVSWLRSVPGKARSAGAELWAETTNAVAKGWRLRVEPRNPSDGGFFYWLGKYYAFGLLALLLHLGLVALWVYGSFARNVPPPPTPDGYRYEAPSVTRIVSSEGRLLAELATEHRMWADIDEIPRLLQAAFLAVEDRRFYRHDGIDWRGVIRAAWTNLKAGRIREGGSTITQQVAKAWLGTERTLSRKVREAILARRLEAVLSKKQILELYLNRIFLGNGAFGVKAAARKYFDKRLDQLTLPEMALIAGLARAPSRYSPTAYPKRAALRRKVVIDKMVEMGVIDDRTARKACQAPLGLRTRLSSFDHATPYFTEHVRRELIGYLGRIAWSEGLRCRMKAEWAALSGPEREAKCIEALGNIRLRKGGYRVETTVDPWVQSVARKNVEELARWMDKRQGWRGPEAHLATERERQEFRERAAALYGTGTTEKGKLYLALVEDLANGGALVRVGSRTYTIPVSRMRWAARYISKNGTTDRTIRWAWQALMVGDVVWVKRAGRKRHPPGTRGRPVGRAAPEAKDPVNVAATAKDRVNVPALWPAEPYLSLEQTPRVQSALLTFDHQTGYVIAMVGGTDFDRSRFNRTTQACRQPGSTYKPVYYSLALDRGWTFERKVKDIPYSIVDPETGRKWYVRDFAYNEELKRKFAQLIQGYEVSLEFALVWSKNNASVHVFKAMGARNVARWARRLGFTTPIIPDDALALGASCTRVDELARSFALFARNGRWLEINAIRRIVDRNNRVILDKSVYYDPQLPAQDKLDRLAAGLGHTDRQAIPAKTAYKSSLLLRRMVQKGHAEPIRQTHLPAAGKTGTSSRTSDTWFVGYTSRWMTAAWLGDDHYTRPLGRHDASFNTTLPMWARYMLEVSKNVPLYEIPPTKPDGTPIHAKPTLDHKTRGTPPEYEAPLGRMRRRREGREAARAFGGG